MDIKEERANFEAGQEAKEVEEKDEEVNEPAPSLVSYIPPRPLTCPSPIRAYKVPVSWYKIEDDKNLATGKEEDAGKYFLSWLVLGPLGEKHSESWHHTL